MTPALSARFIPRVRTELRRGIATATTKPRRSPFPYVYYGGLLLSGLASGFAVRQFLSPSPLPVPGSREDKVALEMLAADIDKLNVVKELRAQTYNLHTDTPLAGTLTSPGSWVELDFERNLTEIKDDTSQPLRTLSQQTLGGSQGFGIQRAFWNADTRELVAVVWFGGALSGWPTLAHGGAIAILFEDAMSRTIAGPDMSLALTSPPTSLSVTYAHPTQILNHYVLRVAFLKPEVPQTAPPPEAEPGKSWLPAWKDLTKKVEPGPEHSVELKGTLESVDGKVCVRAKGTFSVSAVASKL